MRVPGSGGDDYLACADLRTYEHTLRLATWRSLGGLLQNQVQWVVGVEACQELSSREKEDT